MKWSWLYAVIALFTLVNLANALWTHNSDAALGWGSATCGWFLAAAEVEDW